MIILDNNLMKITYVPQVTETEEEFYTTMKPATMLWGLFCFYGLILSVL